MNGVGNRVFFIFVDGEFALVVSFCGLAFLEQADIDILDGFALIIGNLSADCVGK